MQADSIGNTAMHLAVLTKDLEMVMLLDSRGADASKANNDGVTPIDLAG